MSNKNLTKTLFADFRKVDTKKLNINGNPFSKVVTDYVPESTTENDIWKYTVTTDDNGVVTITDDVAVDYSEITDAQKTITQTAIKVIDNKVLDANDALLMNWDTKNFTNENNSDMSSIFGGTDSQKAPVTEWNSDLSSLKTGTGMFQRTSLASFSGDLSSLTNGHGMFYKTNLESFSSDLSNLTNGWSMFSYTALESFTGDLSNLTKARSMFYGSGIQSFSNDLSSLIDGQSMFSLSPLQSFSGDLSSLINGRFMFRSTNLQSFSGNLSSLNDGYGMFYQSPLQSFSGDLSSLTNGYGMFYQSALQSFSGNLSSLTNGHGMFYKTPLESFNGDLSNLTTGQYMFFYTTLESFNCDLSSLTDGYGMFYQSALKSFNGDLSSLINGSHMFRYNQERHYGITYNKIVNGTKTQVTELFESTGLKSFISNLSSLENGYQMFGSGDDVNCSYIDASGTTVTETTKDVVPLDEESIMIIADTIKDINGLTFTEAGAGQLWLGYDSSITDTTNIFKYCDQIVAKGWTVYLNGSSTPYNPSNPAALIDGESSTTHIPHYYKPIQVTDKEIAEYVDANNNYYIIVGGQYIFGDDISTYGMFTSYQHAVTEITTSLGLTKYEKPTEETEQES